jgi:hypothetical protein
MAHYPGYLNPLVCFLPDMPDWSILDISALDNTLCGLPVPNSYSRLFFTWIIASGAENVLGSIQLMQCCLYANQHNTFPHSFGITSHLELLQIPGQKVGQAAGRLSF